MKFAAFCILAVVDEMQDAVTGLTHKKKAFVYGVAKVTLFVLFYIRKNTEGFYVVLTVFLRQVYLVCKSIVRECNLLYGLFIP